MNRGIVSEVKTSIRSLLIATSHTMNILDLEKDYKSFMGTPLPYNALGFKSAEQLLRSMPDVVKILGYGPQAFVQHIPSKKSNHIANLVKHQRTENKRRRRTPRHRKRNSYTFDLSFSDDNDEDADALKKLPINGSKAVPHRKHKPATSFSSSNESERSAKKQQPVCKGNVSTNNDNGNGRLPTSASAQKHEPIDYREQISRKEEAINKRFDLLFNSSKDSDIYDAETKPLTNKTRNTILFGPRIYPIANRKKQNGKIPEDAVTEGIKNIDIQSQKMQKKGMIEIPKCALYEELKKGSIISLYISKINTALEFYFHIDKENHELIKLEKDMREKYSLLAKNELALPDSYLQSGRYCAVKQGSSWYRAKILDVPSYINHFSKIKLLFIDFGCVNSVSVQHLKFLAPIFYIEAVQAARARLSLIKSNERAQSNGANKCFESLTRGRCLYAYIKNVDKETPSFELILLDNSKQPKCNINEAIIKNGFADRE